MTKSGARSASREIALRALYQVEMGGQTLDAALGGAFESARVALVNPVRQSVAEALHAVRAACGLGDRHNLPKDARLRSRLVVAVQKPLNALVQDAGEIAARLCAPEFETALELAVQEMFRSAKRTDEALEKVQLKMEGLFSGLEQTFQALEPIPAHCAEAFRKQAPVAHDTCRYAAELVRGVREHVADIDALIAERTRGWSLERLAIVDREILRLAIFEMRYAGTAPMPVVIDEAVELARKYGSEESSRFVNGVLGALAGRAGPSMGEPALAGAPMR